MGTEPRPAGTAYELLTQEIFQTILDQTEVRTVTVQRDVSLQGRSTAHQIDVYWRFNVAGINHETIIQTKDWAKAVDQGELLKFRAVLDDLPGQPRGVFVTAAGYQRGAESVARKYGIELFQLDEVDEPSEPIRITQLGFARLQLHRVPLSIAGNAREGHTVVLESVVYEPTFSESMLTIDEEWFREATARDAKDAPLPRFPRFDVAPQDLKLFDEHGHEIGDLQQIFREFVAAVRRGEQVSIESRHVFDVPTFVHFQGMAPERLKILAISTNVAVREQSRRERAFRVPNVALFILRKLTEGTVRFHGRWEDQP